MLLLVDLTRCFTSSCAKCNKLSKYSGETPYRWQQIFHGRKFTVTLDFVSSL